MKCKISPKTKDRPGMATFENGFRLSSDQIRELYYKVLGLKMSTVEPVNIEHQSFDVPEDFDVSTMVACYDTIKKLGIKNPEKYIKNHRRKIVGVIPARYHSTRCEGKPLIEINGKPLIQHTYETAKKITRLTHLVVATDDLRIFNKVKKFGSVTMTRECENGSERCYYAAKKLFNLADDDIIVNIQGDYPFFKPEWIDTLISSMDDPLVDIATLCAPIQKSSYGNKNHVKTYVDFKYFVMNFSRECSKYEYIQWKNLGIHAFYKKALTEFVKYGTTEPEKAENIEQLRALEMGLKIKAVIV